MIRAVVGDVVKVVYNAAEAYNEAHGIQVGDYGVVTAVPNQGYVRVQFDPLGWSEPMADEEIKVIQKGE